MAVYTLDWKPTDLASQALVGPLLEDCFGGVEHSQVGLEAIEVLRDALVRLIEQSGTEQTMGDLGTYAHAFFDGYVRAKGEDPGL